MKPQTQTSDYSDRHLSQLIRRKMITRLKPSGKKYSRKTFKGARNERFFCPRDSMLGA
jgi:hypothetical protein